VIFRTGEQSVERRLPLVARDLTWRASSGSTLAQDSEALAGVASLGATGRLLVTLPDSGGCVLSALELPSLEWAEDPPGLPNTCRFAVDEDGAVLDEGTVPEPGGGRRTAICTHGAELTTVTENEISYTFRGCAPAWTPDGRLTFIRNGALFLRGSGPLQQRLLSRQTLSGLFGRPSALEEVAWLDDELFWAVVRSGRRATVALLSTDRLLSTPLFAARMIEGLRAGGTMVAARTERGVIFVDASGTPVFTVPEGQAVAWEPGGQLAAVARPNEVLIVSPSRRRVATLPLGARDLEWVEP